MSIATTTEHDERLLAEVYDWMQGGWDVQVEAHRTRLAMLGFDLAPSAATLRQLDEHAGSLAISLVPGVFDDDHGPLVDLVCCMGDTLTHLESHGQVDRLFQRSHDTLLPGGRLVVSYRDGSSQPEGNARFLPIRSDHDRIFTCFLEAIDDDHTRIHDILHTRNDDGFTQHLSSYVKLRLRPGAVDQSLASAGFRGITTTVERGLVTTVADVER